MLIFDSYGNEIKEKRIFNIHSVESSLVQYLVLKAALISYTQSI